MTPGDHSQPRTRAVVVVAGWTMVGVLLGTQAYLSRAIRDEPVTWWHLMAVWLAFSYAWALLTPPILWLAARYPLERAHLGRALLVHGLAGAASVTLTIAVFSVVAPRIGTTNVAPTWAGTFSKLMGMSFLLCLPVYWMLVGAAQIVRFAQAARARERRALRLEAQLSEARLSALRAQLQPHFLFNTLNTVSVLLREDVDAADRVLVLLSQLLRRALEDSDAHEVSLREELSFLEAYLAIEQTRFADRLSYRVDVPPHLLDARVPSLILQPLVENALRHGIARRALPGHIAIAALRRDDMLHLTVRDNGPGVADGATDGVGLSNTRSRLAQLYGERHSFQLQDAEGGGLIVALAIPLRAPVTA